MMTIHKLTAGDGYTYLTRQVAGGDVQRSRGQGAADYYTAQGNPPGVWTGRGAPLLDLADQTVTEAQMKALFGLGQHPDADAIIAAYLAEHVRAEMTEAQLAAVQTAAVKAASLGRRFPVYEPLDPFQERVRQRLAAIAQQTEREPTAAEAKKVQREESLRQRAAVAGFDVVFAPVKSAAVLWALDERAEVRAAVRRAHEAARDAALELLEQHAAFTRTGDTGQAQIETRGLIAAAFDHYDSRAGDPNLHTHVAISNKVQGVDGRWRSLDARALYAMTVAASEFYNTRFETELSARLGVTFTARADTAGGKEPVREITGVPAEVIEHYSSRRTQIEARYDQLVRDYRGEHGHDPSRAAAHQLARQANLDTRDGKKPARSLEQMRAHWRQSLTDAHGLAAVARVMAAVPAHAPAEHAAPADIPALARTAITNLGEARSTWSVWNVRAEAERLARIHHPTRSAQTHRELVEAVVAAAVSPQHSVRVDAPALIEEPELLRRSDGVSVFTQHASHRYTSRAVLDAEARLLAAANTPTATGLSGPFTAAALDGFEARNRPLDPGQRALVTGFATDPRMLVVGLGPAGSGKTTAMRAYVHVAAQAGVRVIALGTSAASADVLGRELGTRAENLHKFLWEHTHGPFAQQLSAGAPVPPSRAGYALGPGDVVLVDEAGMAGTMNLDRLTTLAESRGASVRLLGDYRQLSAVESGGALRLIAHEAGAVELTHLHRFTHRAEAEATLKLRVGDSGALDFYDTHQRIRGGSRTAMIDAAYAGWKADMLAGKTTLISAANGADVTALSAQARAERVEAGQVEADGIHLHDGNQAGRGDWIITRENNRKLTTGRGRDFVKNGDAWQVLARRKDGSLKVAHLGHRGRLTLPADYVQTKVELLYAATVTRSQGSTVDTAHPLVTEEMTREQLYVALTRAREKTTVYVATHDLLPYERDHQLDATKNDPDTFAAREVLERVVHRQGAQLSATETIYTIQEQASSLSTLVPRHQHATDALTAERYTHLLTRVLGATLSGQITGDAAFSAVVRALNTGEAEHWQPERLIAAAARRGELAAADSPAKLLAWRINDLTGQRTAPAHLNAPSPHDTARYAALIAATGLGTDRLNPAAALGTPAALRADRPTGAAHHLNAETLNRYANDTAAVLGTTASAVAAHRAWPHLTAALSAAEQAGHESRTLLSTAAHATNTLGHTEDGAPRDTLSDLARASRRLLAHHGTETRHLTIPTALRHAHTVTIALGPAAADTARREPAWPALTAALRRAEHGGHDPVALLRRAAASRDTTQAESLSQVLAWRLNRYLTTDPAPAPTARAAQRDTETWRTLAWSLKAAENHGRPAAILLAALPPTARLDEALRHAEHAQLAARQSTTATATTLPPWLAAPASSPDMDPVHRAYLNASADLIAARHTALGEQVFAERPAWSQDLGRTPEDPTARAAWQQQLAVIAAYRDQHQITDDNPAQPAGPYIEPARAGHAAYWHAATAALTARRIADAPHTATAAPSTDRAALHRVAADLYRALPQPEQTAILRALATRTDAAWLASAHTLDDQALTKPALAEHLSRLLAERGHLIDTHPGRDPHPQSQPDGTAAQSEPSLAERRHAGREAERQARRDHAHQRRTQPVRQTQRGAGQRRDEQQTRTPQRPVQPRTETPPPTPKPAQQPIQPPPQPGHQPEPRPRW